MVKLIKLTNLKALEIIDSRGNPTIEVTAYSGKHFAKASAPSGASKSSHEAVELRDGGKRYGGLGVLKAVRNVKELMLPEIKGMNLGKQELIDKALIKLDGTNDKSRLGANAVIAVSIACFKLNAKIKGKEPYELLGREKLPIPYFNIINGGMHAGNELAFQEFMIVPKAKSFAECLRSGVGIYNSLKSMFLTNYGKASINVGDEGGFAPPFKKVTEPLDLIMKAVYGSGSNASIALDVAASSFYSKDKYLVNGKKLSTGKLMDYYEKLVNDYPIISIEDPFQEDDWGAFTDLKRRLKNIDVVGDDLIATNQERLKQAVNNESCSAIILKPNQAGTLTETLSVARTAMRSKLKVIVSHRSGETCDDFIADLAVGLGCGFIKSGAPCRGERTSKYNRLLRIEQMINP